MRHGDKKICDRCGKVVTEFTTKGEVCVGGVREIKAGYGLAIWEVCNVCAIDWKAIEDKISEIGHLVALIG